MPLLKLDKASLHYGTHVLLDNVDFKVRAGDRIGLLGRNGAGKTTLMKVINGETALESGERWLRDGVRIAYLDQSLPDADDQDVYDVVAHGLADVGDALARYHHCILEGDMDGLARAPSEIEAKDGWLLAQRSRVGPHPVATSQRGQDVQLVGWLAPPRRTGQSPGERTRYPDAGRAYQPPGHTRH